VEALLLVCPFASNFSCFNGLFDELRVWSVARTRDEIMTTYTKAVVGNEPGLVGYWKLQGDCHDYSGNGNQRSFFKKFSSAV